MVESEENFISLQTVNLDTNIQYRQTLTIF